MHVPEIRQVIGHASRAELNIGLRPELRPPRLVLRAKFLHAFLAIMFQQRDLRAGAHVGGRFAHAVKRDQDRVGLRR